MFLNDEGWKKFKLNCENQNNSKEFIEKFKLKNPEVYKIILKDDVRFIELNFYEFDNSPFEKAYLFELPLKQQGDNARSADESKNIDESNNRKGIEHKADCISGKKHNAIYVVYLGLKEDYEDSVSENIFFLDGNSSVIHYINRIIHPKSEAIKSDHESQYLDFFCTFVSGEHGPFLTLTSINEICHCDSSEIKPYNEYVENEIKKQLSVNESKKSNTVKDIVNELTVWFKKEGNSKEKDSKTYLQLLEEESSFKEVIWGFNIFTEASEGKETNNKNSIDLKSIKDEHSFETQVLNKLWDKNDNLNFWKLVFDTQKHWSKKLTLFKFLKHWHQSLKESKEGRFLRIVQYGSVFFIASFRVPKNGVIAMEEDFPLTETALAVGHWEFKELKNKKLGVYCLQFFPFLTESFAQILTEASTPLPIITREEFATESKDYESVWHILELSVINSYVGPNVKKNWSAHTFFKSLLIKDVYFSDLLDFSNILTDKNITFTNCSFTKVLSFKNARIGGELTFKNCKFFGIPSDDSALDEKNVALNLNGIRVGGQLSVIKCKFYASIAAKHMHVQQMAKFRGSEIMPLYNFYQAKEKLVRKKKENEIEIITKIAADGKRFEYGTELDIRYSHFGNGLDLSAWFAPRDLKDYKKEGEKFVVDSTVIAGSIIANSCYIGGPLFLSGLITTNLNHRIFSTMNYSSSVVFNNSEIKGSIYSWRQKENANDPFFYSRTYINGYLEFELCKVSGNVDLRGVWVRGNLILSHLTCSGCLELGAIDQYYLDHYDACTQSKMPSVEEFCRYEFSKWILVQEKKDKQTVMHLANFGNTHIQDNLIVSGANIQGEVFLRGAYVGQQILLNSGFYKAIHILPFLSVCAINPDDSKKVKREYLKINSEDKESDFLTYLRIIKVNTETFVENHNGLLTHPTICTGVQIVNTTINGSVNLYGVLVESSDNHFSGETSQQDDNKEGNTKVPCTEIGECSILIEDTTIGGSLVFHDENFVRKRYLKYKRNEWKPYMYQYLFACIDKVNELKPVDWSRLKKLQKEAYTNVSVTKIGGPLNIINSTINGKLDFSGLKVQGRTRISDVKVTAEIKANAVVLKENKVGYRTEILHIDMLQCDGNMLLNKLITNELKAVNTTISGRLEIGDVAVLESNFELRNSTIKGQLDVKKLDVKQDFIFEDLDVFGNITITEKLEVGRCVNINLTRIRGNLDLSKLKTIKSTTLRHTDIHGDLDLSQVDIGGNVAVKYSHIKGNAHMHRKNKTNKIIGETINFTSSNIGVLRMKVRDIPENGTWVFRDATIKHLDIHDFKEEYPSKVESEIDFRGMQFNRLTFDSKEINNGNLDMIKKFLDLGNKTSEDFTLEAYSQVEKYLRNQGRKQEADKIYATLQRRLREKGMIQNKIRICFHYLFFDKFTGFGSNWVTPMFWGIGLLVLSLSVCVSPDNFNGLDNIHWTFGVQKTLEICFPMMGFDGKMDVEFGVNDLTYLFAFNEPCLYLPIPIKVVVLLIQLGAWIIWPVFILTLSGLLKRN